MISGLSILPLKNMRKTSNLDLRPCLLSLNSWVELKFSVWEILSRMVLRCHWTNWVWMLTSNAEQRDETWSESASWWSERTKGKATTSNCRLTRRDINKFHKITFLQCRWLIIHGLLPMRTEVPLGLCFYNRLHGTRTGVSVNFSAHQKSPSRTLNIQPTLH